MDSSLQLDIYNENFTSNVSSNSTFIQNGDGVFSTTVAASSFLEDNVLIIIVALLLICFILFLCYYICCNKEDSKKRCGGGAILPIQAPPPQTKITKVQQTIYAQSNGQPVLKSYKVTTTKQNGENLNQPLTPIRPDIIPPFNLVNYNSPKCNDDNFVDIPLDTVSMPRNVDKHYYARRGLRHYSSDT